jgi:4-hydroxy-tetrahydrodipicolinate synthase
MLYDIPSRTGRKIAGETTVSLARRHANVVALKDASGDLVTAASVKAELGAGFDLYSGDDALLLDFLAVGAVGVVSVAGHWAAPEFRALIEAFADGRLDEARTLNERLVASCRFEGNETYPNPMPSKAALRHLGLSVGECRLPHAPSDDTLNQQAATVVGALRGARG